jgi:hypothetical protein
MTNECGEEVPVHYDDELAVERAITKVIRMAAEHLPRGTVYEVRGKVRPDDPINRDRCQRKLRTRAQLARDWGVAWYWTSADNNRYYGGLKQEPLFRGSVEQAEEAPFGGYIVIARLRVE